MGPISLDIFGAGMSFWASVSARISVTKVSFHYMDDMIVEEISHKLTFHINQYFLIKLSKIAQDKLKLIIMKKSKSQSD